MPCIKGDRDSDRPWGQISQNQSKNDKKGKIVQRSQLCDHLVGRRDTMNAESNEMLPVSEKYMLTIKEAAAYFNIGIKKLRRIAEDINIYHRYIRQGLFRKMSWIGMIISKENENVRTAT